MSNRRKVQDGKEARIAWVKYSLETSQTEGSKGSAFVRSFSAQDPFSKEFDWDNTESQVLLQNIKSLVFEFFDKSKEKWVERLADTGLDKEVPRAVRIKLVWINESGNEVAEVVNIEDSQMIALIAYIQRVGTDLFADDSEAPAEPADAKPAAAVPPVDTTGDTATDAANPDVAEKSNEK